MPDLDHQRKRELECLRLAADSMQLAGDARHPDWQSHFLRRAKFLTALAEQSASADAERTVLTGALRA